MKCGCIERPAGWNLVFLFLLGCQSAAALHGTELFLGFFAVYGLIFLYLNFSNDYFRKIQNYVSIPLVATFIALNYQNLPNILELNSFDLRLMMLPVFMLVTIAAAYRATLRCTFSSDQVIRVVSWGLLAGTAAFLARNNHDLVHAVETRPVGLLLDLNPNLADDVFICVILVTFLGIPLTLVRPFRPGRTVVGLLLWGLFCYAFVYLIEGQSRAAWLAFIVALLLTSAVAFFSKRRVPVSRLAVAAAVLVSFVNADLISSRAGAERIVLGAAAADWSIMPKAASAESKSGAAEGGKAIEKAVSKPASRHEDAEAIASIGQRFILWGDALTIIAKNPVTGLFGWNKERIKSEASHPEFVLRYTHFHNLILDVAVRFGIVMALYYSFVFIFFIFILTRYAVSMKCISDLYNNAVLIVCLFYFVYLFVENIFEVNFYQKQVASVIVLFCALAGVALGMLDRSDGVSEQSR